MIDKVAQMLKLGKVIVAPTDTVYGLMCSALDRKAMQKIYQIKKRVKKKPLPVMFADLMQLKQHIKIEKFQEEIIDKSLPGPVTFVVERNENSTLRFSFPKKIAVRIPNCKVMLKILKAFRKPLVATSVNISGKKEVKNLSEISSYIKNRVELVVANNQLMLGKASTILDICQNRIKVLRGYADCATKKRLLVLE